MKSFIKSKLLLIGLISAISFPLLIVSCQSGANNETDPIEPTSPKPPIVQPPILPENPEPPVINLVEFAKGGTITLNQEEKIILNIDKYLTIVKQLNFNKYSNISTFTNEKLTTVLQASPAFKLLNLTILNGSSQVSGQLLLSLNGLYGGQQIKSEKISITNFWKFSSGNPIKVNNLVELDKFNFINDLRDADNIKNLTTNDFFKYNVKPINISFNSSSWNLNEIYKNGFISNMKFKNVYLNKKDWVASITFVEKKYNGSEWVMESSTEKSLKNYRVSFDVQKSAMKILAQTLTIENNTQANTYASTIFLNSKRGLANWETFMKLEQKIVDKYFPHSISSIKIIAEMGLVANDDDGVLMSSFKLSDSDNPTNFASSTIKSITNFKKSQEILTLDNLALKKNNMIIFPGSALETGLINDLNKPAINSKLKALGVGESASFESNMFQSSLGINELSPETVLFKNHWIDEGNQEVDNSLERLMFLRDKGVYIGLLGQTKSLVNVLKNGLFDNFLFKSLDISKNNNVNSVKVTKENSGNYKLIELTLI